MTGGSRCLRTTARSDETSIGWLLFARGRLTKGEARGRPTDAVAEQEGAGVLKPLPPYHLGFHGRPPINFVEEEEGKRKF